MRLTMRLALGALLAMSSAATADEALPAGCRTPLGPHFLKVMAYPTEDGVAVAPFGAPQKATHRVKLAARALQVDVTGDLKYLLAVCSDRHVVIWDISGKEPKEVRVVAFKPDPSTVTGGFLTNRRAILAASGPEASLFVTLP